MGLGIGLGGFASGFEKGIGIAETLHKGIEKRREKESLDAATAAGKADYDKAVASGEAQAGDPNGILRYTMPKLIAERLKANDAKGAQEASDWVRSDQARQGSTLFANGMLKGQNGDMAGALKDFVAAGRVQGYGGNYEISDPVTGEGGGISVTIKDPSTGKSTVQEFKTPDDVLKFGAAYLNPEAAFKQWQEGQTAKSEYARDVEKAGATERAKLGAKTEDEVVRKNLGIGGKTKDMVAARKQALEELKSTPSFLDAEETQQSALIDKRAREIMSLDDDAEGVGAAPKKKVIVDTKTGQLIPVTE